jgi:hypothetical protein
MTNDWNTPKEQQILAGQTTLPNELITYNDEAVPWSQSNDVLGTRLFPSSDDSDNNFSRTLKEQGLR